MHRGDALLAETLDQVSGGDGVALLLDLWRIALGPDSADRILALDTMVINVIALLVLYGVWRGTAIYFEAAMLIAQARSDLARR